MLLWLGSPLAATFSEGAWIIDKTRSVQPSGSGAVCCHQLQTTLELEICAHPFHTEGVNRASKHLAIDLSNCLLLTSAEPLEVSVLAHTAYFGTTTNSTQPT